MQGQFEALRKAIAVDISEQLAATERRLTTVIAEQLGTAQGYLDGRMRVQTEELSDRFTKFAESYGGTLDGIQRELKEFRAEWRHKVDDTDRVLANHAGRLEATEKTPSDR